MNELEKIELCDSYYVFLDENNKMVTWSKSEEIFITCDEDEIREYEGYTPVKCTDLSIEMQTELKDNIKKYKNL